MSNRTVHVLPQPVPLRRYVYANEKSEVYNAGYAVAFMVDLETGDIWWLRSGSGSLVPAEDETIYQTTVIEPHEGDTSVFGDVSHYMRSTKEI